MRLSLILIGFLTFISSSARADKPRGTTSHDYDVRDLLIVIPDFDDVPSLGIQAVTEGRSPALEKTSARLLKPAGTAAENLVTAVRSLLGEEPDGAVSEESGTLRVTASVDSQERVQSTIHRWREARGRTINLSTRFLTLARKDIATLPPALRQIFDDIALDGRSSTFDAAQLDTVLKMSETLASATLVTAPRITLFQNQRAYVLVTTQRAFVSDFTVVRNGQQPDEFRPVVSIVESGTSVNAPASSNAEGSIFSVDFRSELGKLRGMKTEPWKLSPANPNLKIEIPDVRLASSNCLLTIAAGQSAVVRCADAGGQAGVTEFETVAIVTPTLAGVEMK